MIFLLLALLIIVLLAANLLLHYYGVPFEEGEVKPSGKLVEVLEFADGSRREIKKRRWLPGAQKLEVWCSKRDLPDYVFLIDDLRVFPAVDGVQVFKALALPSGAVRIPSFVFPHVLQGNLREVNREGMSKTLALRESERLDREFEEARVIGRKPKEKSKEKVKQEKNASVEAEGVAA